MSGDRVGVIKVAIVERPRVCQCGHILWARSYGHNIRSTVGTTTATSQTKLVVGISRRWDRINTTSIVALTVSRGRLVRAGESNVARKVAAETGVAFGGESAGQDGIQDTERSALTVLARSVIEGAQRTEGLLRNAPRRPVIETYRRS